MYIEDFRKNDLGAQICTIHYSNGEVIDLPLYHISYFNAIIEDITLHLQSFENAKQTIPIDDHALGTMSTIFNVIEVFISTVQIILFYLNKEYNGKTYNDVKKMIEYKFDKKISEIVRMAKIDKKAFYDKDYARLQELLTFRNDLMHGRLVLRKQKHLNLSNIPFRMNISDIMEALYVAIAIINKLRFVIKGIDLMPLAPVFINNDKNICLPVDRIYSSYFYPWYIKILENFNIQSMFVFEKFNLPLKLNYISNHRISSKTLLKIAPQYFIKTKNKNSSIREELLKEIEKLNKDAQTIHIPHVRNIKNT